MTAETEMTFFEHLELLRRVILKSLLVFGLLLIPGWYAAPELIRRLIQFAAPDGFQLHYFTLMEPFFVRLKMSAALAFLAALPFLVFFLWQFIKPGLMPEERKFGGIAVVTVIVLALFGLCFSILFIMPAVIAFSLSFAEKSMSPVIGIDSFVSMFLCVGVACALLFQFPVILYALLWGGFVQVSTLRSKRGIVLVVILFLAALLSPPDVMSQILLAVPTYLLFELTLLVYSLRKPKDESYEILMEEQKGKTTNGQT